MNHRQFGESWRITLIFRLLVVNLDKGMVKEVNHGGDEKGGFKMPFDGCIN